MGGVAGSESHSPVAAHHALVVTLPAVTFVVGHLHQPFGQRARLSQFGQPHEKFRTGRLKNIRCFLLRQAVFYGDRKISALYLSMSNDHASSLPARQALTSRVSFHAAGGFLPALVNAGLIACIPRPIFEIELLHIPEDIGFQNGGMEIANGILGAGKNVRARQKNHGLILGENLLRAVIQFLPLFEGTRGHLFFDQPIDFASHGVAGCACEGFHKCNPPLDSQTLISEFGSAS